MTDLDAKLLELTSLPENWNGEGEKPTTNAAAMRAKSILTREAFIAPHPNGGCQIEWHFKDWYLEIELDSNGNITHILKMKG